MKPKRQNEPYLAFRFIVSVDGGPEQSTSSTPTSGKPPDPGLPLPAGGFNEVSGLTIETEVETLRAGGQNHADVLLAGPTKFPSRLVLKRGLVYDSFIWDWYRSILKGAIVRRNVTVTLQDPEVESESERPHWTFLEACPVKWTGPSLQAGSASVAFESIELVHRGLLP